MNRSQRILAGIGLAALVALAAPYLTRAVVDSRATAGKALVLEARSQRPDKDLVLCLISASGRLGLVVASNDTYTNPASGLAIRVKDRQQHREVRVWLPEGQQLAPAQLAQIQGCIAAPASGPTA